MHAELVGRPARDFDTTLAVALIGPTISGFGQVGDSIMVIETPEGEVLPVTPGDRGEYANETYFVTRDRELSRLSTESRITSELRGVVLSTDGLERVAVQRRLPSRRSSRGCCGSPRRRSPPRPGSRSSSPPSRTARVTTRRC